MPLDQRGADGRYHCFECDLSWTRHEKLKEHMRSHTGERLSCPDGCLVTFKDRPNLTAHLREKHGGPRALCLWTDSSGRINGCGKEFRKAIELIRHLKGIRARPCRRAARSSQRPPELPPSPVPAGKQITEREPRPASREQAALPKDPAASIQQIYTSDPTQLLQDPVTHVRHNNSGASTLRHFMPSGRYHNLDTSFEIDSLDIRPSENLWDRLEQTSYPFELLGQKSAILLIDGMGQSMYRAMQSECLPLKDDPRRVLTCGLFSTDDPISIYLLKDESDRGRDSPSTASSASSFQNPALLSQRECEHIYRYMYHTFVDYLRRSLDEKPLQQYADVVNKCLYYLAKRLGDDDAASAHLDASSFAPEVFERLGPADPEMSSPFHLAPHRISNCRDDHALLTLNQLTKIDVAWYLCVLLLIQVVFRSHQWLLLSSKSGMNISSQGSQIRAARRQV